MKTAIISVTGNGRILSAELKKKLEGQDVVRYCFYRNSDESAKSYDNIGNLVSEIFHGYDSLIFICACGIAVRSIAPYVESKTSDPGVIVIDDKGKFVISLLSGHLGGANALAEYISRVIDAVPVITTATDTGKQFSPDTFAKANNLIITDMNAAKEIAAAVLNGEKIGLYSEYGCINIPHELAENIPCRTGIYIGGNIGFKPFGVTLQLIPKNISVGIGCKKGTPSDVICGRVEEVMEKSGISMKRISDVSSVDLKSGEKGIHEFCSEIGLKPFFYSAEELMKAEGEFTPSVFVKTVTGVDNVCERAAVMKGGKLVIRKNAGEGVTVAAAEKEITIDFGRRII